MALFYFIKITNRLNKVHYVRVDRIVSVYENTIPGVEGKVCIITDSNGDEYSVKTEINKLLEEIEYKLAELSESQY